MLSKKGRTTNTDISKATHEEHSRTGMQLASHIWSVEDDTDATESVMPVVHTADIDAAMVAAKVFKRKEQAGRLSFEKQTKEGELVVDTSCSVNDIHKWLEEIGAREDEAQIAVSNDSQLAIVNLAAGLCCNEMFVIH